MEPLHLLLAVLLSAILMWPGGLRRMLEALADALNNFRGGPPTPMHPSPADDGALLRSRAPKIDE